MLMTEEWISMIFGFMQVNYFPINNTGTFNSMRRSADTGGKYKLSAGTQNAPDL